MPDVMQLPWYAKLTTIMAGFTLFIFILVQASSILIPFLFSVFFAILLLPLASFLEDKRIHRVFSSLISVFIGIVILTFVILFFYNQIVRFTQDIGMIERRIKEIFDQLSGFVNFYLGLEPDTQLESARDTIVTFLRDNAQPLTRGVLTAATTITMFFLVPIYVFLLLLYRDFLHHFFLLAFAANNQEGKVEHILNKIRDILLNYITGMFLVIGILVILNSAALLIIGVDHALFFGVFAAMLNVIPFLGPIIGSILPIVYAALTMDSLWYPVAILATFYVIQLFESNFFRPLIVGHKVSVNPLVALLAIFVGGKIWGLAGMILFIPGIAILKEICDQIESLQPYGYLLGKVKTKEEIEQEFLSGKLGRLAHPHMKDNKGKDPKDQG